MVNPSGAMKTPVESYVVRIYRRQGSKSRQLVGVVEGPRLAGAQAFSGVEELWEILAAHDFSQLTKARPKHADPSSS